MENLFVFPVSLENDANYAALAEVMLSRLSSPVQVAERYGKKIGLLKDVADEKLLFKRAEEGELLAVQYVNDIIDALARLIHNLAVSFNSEWIIIGGGISVRENLIARIRDRAAYHLEK